MNKRFIQNALEFSAAETGHLQRHRTAFGLDIEAVAYHDILSMYVIDVLIKTKIMSRTKYQVSFI